MKKNIFLLFLLAFHTALLQSQTWSQFSDFPAAGRDDGVAVKVNNKGYFGSGFRDGLGVGTDFYSFDLATETWSAIASMPGNGRQYAVAFSNPNYFFVYGGWGDGNFFFNDLYRYDIAANTWSLMATKPGPGIMAACSFTLNDKAYVVCGRYGNDSEVSNQVWEYNMTTNIWTQKNNFPVAIWRGSATIFNGTAYVMLGKDANLVYRKEVYKYDPAADSWTKIADFPGVKRYYTALQGLATKMVLFGGIDTNDVFYKETWFFDESNGFVQGPDLPSFERRGGMSIANGNVFYYSSGLSASGRTTQSWKLDVPVGIKENSMSNCCMKLFPNPAANTLHIDIIEPGCRYELISSYGAVLQASVLPANNILDVSSLKKGLYFLKLFTADQRVYTARVIKD